MDGSPDHTAPELCVSVWFLGGESPGHTVPGVCLSLVSSSSVLLYVHRDRRGYYCIRVGAQVTSHSTRAPELCL